MFGFVLLMSLGLAVFAIAGAAVVWRTLTRPRRRTYATAVARGIAGTPDELDQPRAWTAWSVRSRGLELPVWSVRGDRPDGPVVVATHGWSDSRIGGLLRTPALAKNASWVVLWDQRGHGEAPGASDLGVHAERDLLAVIERAASELPEIGAHGVVLMGWSMGAGVALSAGAALLDPEADGGGAELKAVIAESPYLDPRTPARAVLRALGLSVVWTLPVVLPAIALRLGLGRRAFTRQNPFGFDRLGDGARLGSVPLLVLHGEADPVCPLGDGIALAESAQRAELVRIPDAAHNNLWTDAAHRERSDEATRAFLGSAVNSAGGADRDSDGGDQLGASPGSEPGAEPGAAPGAASGPGQAAER